MLMLPQPECCFILGLPGAGKTMSAQMFMADGREYSCIHFDLLRKALHGQDYIPEAEPWVESIACAMTGHALLDGQSVLIDESITTPHIARSLIAIASQHHAKIRMVHINTPEEICRSRRVPNYMTEQEFSRKAREWSMYGECILGLADETLIIHPPVE